jgi:hypothetical protein
MGPTQPPIQWVSGALTLGVNQPGREAEFTMKAYWGMEAYLHTHSFTSALDLIKKHVYRSIILLPCKALKPKI